MGFDELRKVTFPPFLSPRGPLSDAQLNESVARLRAADASIDAGKGIEASEALKRIAAGHGFAIDG